MAVRRPLTIDPRDLTLSSRPSIWDHAYDSLQEEKASLIEKYEKLLKKILAENCDRPENPSGSRERLDTDINVQNRQRQMERLAKRGLELYSKRRTVKVGGHEINLQDQLSDAAKVVEWAQGWIGEAVQDSPQASLAWAAVCLGLPLLTKPAATDRDNREGFAYVTSRLRYYVALERMMLPENWKADMSNSGPPRAVYGVADHFKDSLVELYKKIIEFQVKTMLRLYGSSVKVHFSDMFKNEWKPMQEEIQRLEKFIDDKIQQIGTISIRGQLHELVEEAKKSTDIAQSLLLVSEQQLRVGEEACELNAQQVDIGEQQVHIQQRILRSMTTREEHCHQMFRISDGGENSSYEWYKDNTEDRIEGTCEWFLKHKSYVDWKDGSSGLLLVSAGPGCGKSVLAKHLIDHEITDSPCYFFFKDQIQNTAKQALCAVLHQLFGYQPALIDHAMPAYLKNGQKLIEVTSKMWTILRNIINDPQRDPITIVMDALDECSTSSLKELLRELIPIFTADNGNRVSFKMILTSRPYQDIIVEFHELVDRFPNIHIPGAEHSDEISQEIDCMVKHRVAKLATKLKLAETLSAYLQKRLLATRQRTYLWVYLIFESLEDPRVRLKKTQKGIEERITSLPQDVNDAYEQILRRSTDQALARRVLCIMLAARRLLTLGEMNIAANIQTAPPSESIASLDLEADEDFGKSLADVCGLLVSVYGDRVQFLHTTVREFLLPKLSPNASPVSPQLGKWCGAIKSEQAHACLVAILLVYLRFSEWQLPLFNDLVGRRRLVPFPTSRYSIAGDLRVHQQFYTFACYWPYHLRRVGDLVDPQTLDHAAQLCCTSALSCFYTIKCHYKDGYIQAFQGSNALMVASFLILEKLVQVLLPQHDVNSRSSFDRHTALHYAALAPEIELPNYTTSDIGSELNADSHLYQLAKERVWHHLRDGGVNINAANNNGDTALHLAARKNHVELVRTLLDDGADTDVLNRRGESPLAGATLNRNWTPIRQLIEHGVDLRTRGVHGDGRFCLHRAIICRQPDIVKLLLDHGVSVEDQHPNEKSPVGYAAQRGSLEVLKMLVDHGANVQGFDENGETALHKAAGRCFPEMVYYLLRQGIDVNVRRVSSGQTPLHQAVARCWDSDNAAAEANFRETLRILLAHGANMEEKDKRGQVALHVAATRGAARSVQILLDLGACVNEKDQNGNTALHMVAEKRSLSKVQALLEGGADIRGKDERGRTAFHIATELGCVEIVRLMLDHGAKGGDPISDAETALKRAAKLREKAKTEAESQASRRQLFASIDATTLYGNARSPCNASGLELRRA